jgi:hypothetical protein
MKQVLVFHPILLFLNKSIETKSNFLFKSNPFFRTRFQSGDEYSPSSARSSQRSTTTTHQHQHSHYEQQPSTRIEKSTYASGCDVTDTDISATNGTRHGIYSNGRPSGRVPPQHNLNGSGRNGYSHDSLDHRYNGSRYNEPENNKSVLI